MPRVIARGMGNFGVNLVAPHRVKSHEDKLSTKIYAQSTSKTTANTVINANIDNPRKRETLFLFHSISTGAPAVLAQKREKEEK